jgi:hypothetical protein
MSSWFEVHTKAAMSDFTLQSLNVAIGSLVFEREALTLRIESVSAAIEEEEQLSEQVQLIEEALGEFRDAYKALRGDGTTHPPYEAVVATGVRSAREVFKRRGPTDSGATT